MSDLSKVVQIFNQREKLLGESLRMLSHKDLNSLLCLIKERGELDPVDTNQKIEASLKVLLWHAIIFKL